MSNDNDGHRDQPVSHPSPDLSHLHPDTLDVGSVGVFAGDGVSETGGTAQSREGEQNGEER